MVINIFFVIEYKREQIREVYTEIVFCDKQQIHELMMKKVELEKITTKYYSFKSLIYHNNINLKTELSTMLIAEYEEKCS